MHGSTASGPHVNTQRLVIDRPARAGGRGQVTELEMALCSRNEELDNLKRELQVRHPSSFMLIVGWALDCGGPRVTRGARGCWCGAGEGG